MCSKDNHNFILQNEPIVVQSELVGNKDKEWKDFVILHCNKCGKILKQYVDNIELNNIK